MLRLALTAATLCGLASGATKHLVAVSRNRRVLTSISTSGESSGQSVDFALHGVDLPSHVASDVSTQLVYWADGNANGSTAFIGFFNFTSHTEGFFAQLPPGTDVAGLTVNDNATTVYYASAANGSIVGASMNGEPVTAIASGLNGACCVVAHRNTGDLFWKELIMTDGSPRDAIFAFSRKSSRKQLLYTERKALVTMSIAVERTGKYLFWCSTGASTQALLRFELQTKYIFNMPLDSVYGDCASLAADDRYVYLLTSFDNRSNALYAIPVQRSENYITILRPTSATDYNGITVADDVASSTATQDTESATVPVIGLAAGLSAAAFAIAVTTAIICKVRRHKQRKPSSKRGLQIEVVSACKMADFDGGTSKEASQSINSESERTADVSSRARTNSYISPAGGPAIRAVPSSGTLFEPYEEPVPTGPKPLLLPRRIGKVRERQTVRPSEAATPDRCNTNAADDTSALTVRVNCDQVQQSCSVGTDVDAVPVVNDEEDGRASASVYPQRGSVKGSVSALPTEINVYDTASLISARSHSEQSPFVEAAKPLSSAPHSSHDESPLTFQNYCNVAAAARVGETHIYDPVPDETVSLAETVTSTPIIYDAVPDETALQMDASRLRRLRHEKRHDSNAASSTSGERQSTRKSRESDLGNFSQTGVVPLQQTRAQTEHARSTAAAAVAAAAAAAGAQFLSRKAKHSNSGGRRQTNGVQSQHSGNIFRENHRSQFDERAIRPKFVDGTADADDGRVMSAKEMWRASRQSYRGQAAAREATVGDYANVPADPGEAGWQRTAIISGGRKPRHFQTVREAVFHRTPLADVQQSFRDAVSDRGTPISFPPSHPALSETLQVNPWLRSNV